MTIYTFSEVFKSGRLVVCISKVDQLFECGSDNRDPIDVELFKNMKSIAGEQMELTQESIIPLCGKMGYSGRRLSNILKSGPESQAYRVHYENDFDTAVQDLAKHPNRQDIDIPGGEGNGEIEAIKNLSANSIVSKLDHVTGIQNLTKR